MKPPYRADIDGLRAVAVLLVLVFHFRLFGAGKSGFIGVDVFFVISGYLITSIVARQLGTGTFGLGAFYAGRIRRLAPALIATIAMTLAAGALLLFPGDLIELSRQALYSQLYVANLYYWANVNYFGLATGDVLLLHTWSLAVEEQFYLLYPLALLGLHRYARHLFWPAIILGFIVSFALNVAFVGSKPEATFYLLPSRAWELLAGALLVPIDARWRRARLTNEVLGALGVGLVCAAVAFYRSDIRFPGVFALLPVGGAVCLLLCGSVAPSAVSRALSMQPLIYVGRISYPLYLVHWPINVFAGQWLGDGYTIGWRAAMFCLSFALAAVLFHLIENPIRYRRALASNGRMLIGYGAGISATVIAFAVVTAGQGLPQRFPPEVNRLASYSTDRPPPLRECEFAGQSLARPEAFCQIGASGERPSWVVYGDSHAWATHAAFNKWLKLRGEAGLFMYRNSCPPLTGIHMVGDKGVCHAFNREVTSFLDSSEVRNVVLVSTWRQAIEGRLSSKADSVSADPVSLFDAHLSGTISHLGSSGKQVWVWEPVPGAAQSVPTALARAALFGKQPGIEFTTEQYAARNAFFFAAINKIRHSVAGSFSPAAALCNSGLCAVSHAGAPLYFDNAHAAASSVDFWVGVLSTPRRQSSARLPAERCQASPHAPAPQLQRQSCSRL